MMPLKRFGGVLMLAFGAIGLIACLAAIYETGAAKKQLLSFVGQAFDSTETAMLGIHEHLHKIGISVADMRVSLKSGASRADALSVDGIQEKDLVDFQALTSDFGEDIQKNKDRLRFYEERVVWWIEQGSILVPLFMLWLGAGQFCLMYFGWRMVSAERDE